MDSGEDTDTDHAAALSSVRPASSTHKYPIGTIALYGPDDSTTTKIVAAVIRRENSEPILERWVGTSIGNSPKVQRQIREFFDRHHVKSAVATDGNLGCPHEEGLDFPTGEDCPFCPSLGGETGKCSEGLRDSPRHVIQASLASCCRDDGALNFCILSPLRSGRLSLNSSCDWTPTVLCFTVAKDLMPARSAIPEVGQAVRVRNRLATVRAVEPYDSRTGSGRLHIVDVEYLDDWRYPEAEQLLWEVEATAPSSEPPRCRASMPTALTAPRRCRRS